MLLYLTAGLCLIVVLAWVTHWLSYRVIKMRTLRERAWDYNICCGTTDGGGINADIVKHGDIPRFEQITDVTRLPHPDQAFEHVLCSHTLEHVADPAAMYRELRRVGRNITLLIPPLWDFTAALQFREHQVIFLSLRSRYDNELPPYINFAPARWLQARMGQDINVDSRCGGRTEMQVAADYAVPLCFGAAMIGCFLNWTPAVLGVPLGCVAFWLSTRRPR
jgi:hypothetical protein